MTEKLKFTITYSKTMNIGNYESEKYTLSQEFYVGDISQQGAMELVRQLVEGMIYGVPQE